MSDTRASGMRIRGAWMFGLAMGLSALSGCGPADELDDEDVDTGEWADRPKGWNGVDDEAMRNIMLANMPHSQLCANDYGSWCEVSGAWDAWQNAYPIERGQIIKALSKCAFAANFSVSVPGYGGGSFPGVWNWVSGFKSASLSTVQQEKLSGCVLALINANQLSVEISIIAPHAPELPDYTMPFQEAVYYGNLWWQDPARIACGGIQEDYGDRVPGRNKRICDNAGNPCHIDAIGACNGPYLVHQSGYCVQWAGSGDGKYCAVARDDGTKQWHYPSTVYLATEPAIVFGPLYRCGDGNDWCPPEY